MRKIITLFAIFTLLSSAVFAQKVYKVQTIKEKKEQEKDQVDYKWKLYVYDDGTSAAFTMSGKRITPNVLVRPFYCGGGLFKVFSKHKNGLGFSYISLYNQDGKVVISDTLGCLNAFYQGNDCVKLMRKKTDGTEIYAAYSKEGECMIPFEPEYTFMAYYPDNKSHWCSDKKGDWYTYNESGDDYAQGKYNLAKETDREKFNSNKRKTIRRTRTRTTKRINELLDYKETVDQQGSERTIVYNSGYSVMFDTMGNPVIPLSRGYNAIKFVPVIGHVGYYLMDRNDKIGVCDINGNELLCPKYAAIEYNSEDGFVCQRERGDKKKAVKLWLDINGVPCEKKYKDVNSVFIDTNLRRYLVVCPDPQKSGDVITLAKYIEDGVVRTDKLPKSKGYTDITIRYDGPYYSNGDTMYYNGYYTYKDTNVGVYYHYGHKDIISPNRGYSSITAVHAPNEAGYNNLYYLVTKGGKYGACDYRGKEVVEPKYTTLYYDKKDGFITKSASGKWNPIGVYFTCEGKAYKSDQGNLYYKYSGDGDKALNSSRYSKAKKAYAKALKYDHDPYAYYNYGVALYNNDDYKRAEKAFYRAYSRADSEGDRELASQALELSRQSRAKVEERSQKRWEAVAQAGLFVLGATAAVMQASMYTNPTVVTPGGYPSAANYNYDQVFNQIMAQTIVQTNVQMAQQQELFNNLIQTSMVQVEQQNRAEYNNFVMTTGSNISYEEYLQMKAQAMAQSQQGGYAVETETGGTYNNDSHEEIRRRNQEFNDRYGYKDCPHCSIPGNGKCGTCNGTGMQDSGFGLGKIECANCKSNKGKCQWCGGKGKRYGLK